MLNSKISNLNSILLSVLTLTSFFFLVNDELLHDINNGIEHTNGDEGRRTTTHSPPPPTYESAVATGERNDLMKRLRMFLGVSHHGDAQIFSPRISLAENVCNDVSGLPTYEEALML